MAILFVGFKMRAFLFGAFLAALVMLFLVEFLDYNWIIGWFGGVNIITFLLMGKDKLAAKSGWRRTPEAALLGMAFAGGFPGLFAGRKVFQHKTSKTSFILSMWILFFMQLGLVAYFVGNITNVDDLLGAIGVEKKEAVNPQ